MEFQALSSYEVHKYVFWLGLGLVFNENSDLRLSQGSIGWVFKSTCSASGVRGTQDKLPRVQLSPVVAVKPVQGCKKQSHCTEIVLTCSQ